MKKILLVDDSHESRSILRLLLMDYGHDVFEVSSGHEAITFLDRESVDLVISDLEMPNGDGRWLIREMKAHYQRVPIIILSGDVTAQDMEIKKAGALGFFLKPVSILQLVKFIEVAWWRD